jgi:hypothetical protein
MIVEINPNQFVYKTTIRHESRKDAEGELLKAFFSKIKTMRALVLYVRNKRIWKERRFDTKETWWVGQIRFHVTPLSKHLKKGNDAKKNS